MTSSLTTIATVMALYAAVVISPGPSFALVSRLAVSSGQRTAAGATLGLALASCLYAVLCLTGLAILLTRIGWLADVVQVLGGCYLVYLGLTAWRAGSAAPQNRVHAGGGGFLRGLRLGVLMNLSNPKGLVFFIGLYAVAVPSGTALWAKLVILAGGFMLEIVWYGLVALLLSSRPARAAYDRFGIWIERMLGTVLAAFGLRLIWEKLP